MGGCGVCIAKSSASIQTSASAGKPLIAMQSFACSAAWWAPIKPPKKCGEQRTQQSGASGSGLYARSADSYRRQVLHTPPRCLHGASAKIGRRREWSRLTQLHLGSVRPVSGSKQRLSTLAMASVASAGKVSVEYAGDVPLDKLLDGVELAARRGAEVIKEAVDKPRSISYKQAVSDLVTDTDKNTEEAILEVVRQLFPGHLVLGEEGGVSGDASSDYLWCIDPLDGTTNFAHGYPCFSVSIGVLWRGKPAAACVVEFAGGPFAWVTRTYKAAMGMGAYCEGQQIHVSKEDKVERALLVTGFGYDHDEAWSTNIELFKHFTDVSRGVRRLGSAAVDMCHVSLGISEAYWEYRLKPWDMCAGVLMVQEAGGKVSRMDGGDFSVFDRSVLVSNGSVHAELLDTIAPATQKLIEKGLDFSQWYKPKGYMVDV